MKAIIHCSELPRIMECSASIIKPELRVDGNNDDARLGTAVHSALSIMVRGGSTDLDHLAKVHLVDVDSLRILYFAGMRVWESEFKATHAVIATEVNRRTMLQCGDDYEVQLMGSADVECRIPNADEPSLAIIDWKTGSTVRDASAQVKGYALMTSAEYPAHRVQCHTVYLRGDASSNNDPIIETVTITPDDARAQIVDGLSRAFRNQNRFSPSYESCAYCPRQINCAGRTALVHQAINNLNAAETKMDKMTPLELAALYPQAKLLEKVLEHFHATLRNAVAVAGSIATPDGKTLTIQQCERSEIDLTEGWKTLVDQFGTVRAFLPALKVSKSDLCDMVKSSAGRGEKGKAVDAFIEKLAAAGAIRKSTYTALAVTKQTQSGNVKSIKE